MEHVLRQVIVDDVYPVIFLMTSNGTVDELLYIFCFGACLSRRLHSTDFLAHTV